MSEEKIEAFLFYRSYREAINGMTAKDQLATLLAICDYALYGVEPSLTGTLPKAVFTVVKPTIDANKAKRRAGKKGGRPPKKTIGFQTEETIGFSKGETNEEQRNEEQRNEEQRNEEQRNEEQRNGVGAAKPPTRPRFVPPTVEEVAAYVRERGSKVDPQGFIDFYAAKNWMVGKNKMTDWKAACRNAEHWERWNKKPEQDRVKTDADYGDDDFFR